MADRENGKQDTGKRWGLSVLFREMNDSYRGEVVKRALDWRSSVSPGARAALNSAINSYVDVDGFRNADKGDDSAAP